MRYKKSGRKPTTVKAMERLRQQEQPHAEYTPATEEVYRG